MELTEQQISNMSSRDLLSHEVVYSIFDLSDDDPERARLQALLEIRAQELNIEKQFSKVMRACAKADKKLAEQYSREYAAAHANIPLKFDGKGNPLVTIDNFYIIMCNDDYYKNLQFNELAHCPEIVEDGKIRRWTDEDDAASRHYIETKYHIYSESKHNDALRMLFRQRSYHPIRNIIDAIEWDGIERIPTFLHRWMKCEDTPYTREVSRLIFAGGINRLYKPGCKFDDVVVLIGTKQGEGKSTFVRWLAIKDEYFAEVNEFDGQKGMEAIEGAWICEIAELLAMTKTKEQEAIKAYITRQADRYRRPFDRRVTEYKRQCIFIGTTNKEQFLTDKTGGRRFFPVKVHQSGYDLFAHEQEIKAEILQCWAEAKAKMDQGKMPPYANPVILDAIKSAQEAAQEDDYREGLIASYLENKDECCILELWVQALGNDFSKPSKKDSNEIALILQSLGWESTERKRTAHYGQQRIWRRIKPREVKNAEVIDELMDDLPIL